MTKPQMRWIVVVDNYTVGAKFIAIYSIKRPKDNRRKEYKFTPERYERYQVMMKDLWANGRAMPDFTRAHTWGIDPIYENEELYDPYSPEEGRWPYK